MSPLERGDRRPAPGKVAWYVRYSTLGLQFAAAVSLFTFVGHLADQHWGWEPWGTLLGVALGFAAATAWLYREVYSRKLD
ncbi:MAG: AtpZ/AtpI family protein [Planctomycetes bacterium]|nr:AtpZ/AtpI family protein [Planctomycetota bacterium]